MPSAIAPFLCRDATAFGKPVCRLGLASHVPLSRARSTDRPMSCQDPSIFLEFCQGRNLVNQVCRGPHGKISDEGGRKRERRAVGRRKHLRLFPENLSGQPETAK